MAVSINDLQSCCYMDVIALRGRILY